MDNSVILKGSPYGIAVIINEGSDYSTIKNRVLSKFKDSEGFFKGASVGISFEGNIILPDNCQLDLLNAIADNTSLDIVCLIDKREETVAYYKDIVEAKDKEPDPIEYRNYSTIIREDITPENSINSPMGILVMGNVVPGGQITSDNDIIILGSAAGTVKAGTSGNKKARVYALNFNGCDISIAGVSDKAGEKGGSILKKLHKTKGLICAYLDNEKICFEQVK